jgi:transposase-like protein
MAKRKKEPGKYSEIAKELLKDGNIKTLKDVQETLKSMFGDVLKEMLEEELTETLGYEKNERNETLRENSRNGYRSKNIRTSQGEMEIEIPRDRNGEYEPIIIPNGTKDITELEEKIINMYSRGMTTRDISAQIEEMYGFEVSAEMVSRITNKLLPIIKEWQQRPLDAMYAIIFMDGIYYNVREEGRVVKKVVYVVIGVNLDGEKDVLGLYVDGSESAKYWMSVLSHLKSRGVEDILIASIDGLKGFEQAIQAVYPKTEIQRCIIHQIRSTLKYVTHKNKKEFVNDLKSVYKAIDEKTGYENLQKIKEKWGDKFYVCFKSWEDNWTHLSTFFQYDEEIRKIMYTTNVIESLNRQYRKYTKTKTIFPNDDSLIKMMYLATMQITKKWTSRYHNWNSIISKLTILYEERLEPYLNIN